MNITYFIPGVSSPGSDELVSIQEVIEIIESNTDLSINIAVTWNDLILNLHNNCEPLLVVLRLDYLNREHIELDDVLTMLGTLTRFLSSGTVSIALVVDRPYSYEVVEVLKRNGIRGLIPGMRFYPKEYSLAAYSALALGNEHWPGIVIKKPTRYTTTKSPVLTKREQQVFPLVARLGLTNKKVAERLNVSEDTVKRHVSSIMKKYGVTSRTQLALSKDTKTLS